MCAPGWTHDRVITHKGEDPECSYETDQTRNSQKLYKAAVRKHRDKEAGKNHARSSFEPWDEAIAKKMKARLQEDEWRRCLKKRSRASSDAARTQLTSRTHATQTSAASMAPTSCSMVTAGLGNAEANHRSYGGNGVLAYGKLSLPVLPEDRQLKSTRSVVPEIQEDEDYESAIGMCRTDRLTRLLGVQNK